jgi:outer membrane protein OmpA-like peptidoglycan-associated protein
MPRRTNPWPAFVDLFSALLIASFAGFIMLSGAYQHELAGYQEAEIAKKKTRDEADRIIDQVKKALEKDNMVKAKVRSCGEDTCIDLYMHFGLNDDTIAPDERRSLESTCEIIKNALDELPAEQRTDIALTIEGHTDSKQVSYATDPRTRHLFNWNLSAKRATSVLYVFQNCGLGPPVYKVVAIGYADSKKLCSQPTSYCDDQNRRTTLLLHADTQSIEARLKQQGQ